MDWKHYQIARKEEKLRRGPWLEEEDEVLAATVALLGESRWDALAEESGLRRSGKSCRMRWMNYLRPNLKQGQLTEEEEQIILQLHHQWGNKWSRIARRLPGRTDNEIKNYWRSHLRKKALVLHEQSSCDTVITRIGNGDGMPGKDDILETSIGSTWNIFELLECEYVSSPYEARLSDWISYETSETENPNGDRCCSSELCWCYTAWISKDGDTSTWDSSDSIWDLD